MYSEEETRFLSEGARLYAAKDYDRAAAAYADACAAYNERVGADDADLLLSYGKALFQNGVARLGVLGPVNSEAPQPEKKEEAEESEFSSFGFEEGVAEGEENADVGGDESGEEGEAEENGDDGEPGADQSDFEAAWEILDLARALFEKEAGLLAPKDDLPTPYLTSESDKAPSEYIDVIRKLSETYDLLGEVSLELEQFPQAASDLRACLELRQKLYDAERSSLVSESHYKLSLALEFCVEDPDLRAKAADEMKKAIAIVSARRDAETDPAKRKESTELLGDLEERHNELKKDPEMEVQAQQMDMIKGLLGEAVGSSGLAAALQKPVNDLSAMVKKRKPSGKESASKRKK